MRFFETNVGKVVRFDDPHVDGDVRNLWFQDAGDEVGYSTHLSIITAAGFSEEGNYQLANSIGKSLYLYVFSDRPGSMQVKGLSFRKTCEGEVAVHGVQKMREWYKKNKVSKRRTPVRLTFCNEAIDVLVRRIDYNLEDTQTYMVPWTLHLDVLPELEE